MEWITEAAKIIYRRRERTLAAISAIAAGVFILITTAGVSLYFKDLSHGISRNFQNKLFVCEKKSFWIGGGIISEAKLPVIKSIPDIKHIIPMLLSRLENDELATMGIPFMAVGIPEDSLSFYISPDSLMEGKLPESPDEAVIGWDIANSKKLRKNSLLTIRDKNYKVSGVLKKTGSVTDRQAATYLSSLQQQLARQHLLTAVIIIPQDSSSIPAIKKALESKIGYLTVLTEKELESGMKESVDFWNSLTFIFLILSAIASLFSISTSTSMSVTERIKEIAVKKAIGADNSHIFIEFLSESIIVGFLGWVMGLVFSLLFVVLTGLLPATRDASVFRIDYLLAAGSLLWTLFIALIATWLPVRKITTLNISETIRK